jgi:hypothetical protein
MDLKYPLPWLLISIKNGMHFDICDDLKAFLVDAGFVNVVECRFPVPIGSRARGYKYKEADCWNHARLSDGLKDFSLRVLTNAGLFYHDTMTRLRKVWTAIRPAHLLASSQFCSHQLQQAVIFAVTRLHRVKLGARASFGRVGPRGNTTGHITGHVTRSRAYKLLP